MPTAPWVTLARIVRPQGRRGEVIAELLTDFPERFADRKHLFLQAPESRTEDIVREVELDSFREHQGRIVLKFAQTDSIEAAEMLRNLLVVLPFEQRAPLGADSAYISDLIGCELFNSAMTPATKVGVIADVDRGATNVDLLIVEMEPSGRSAEIPFVKDFLEELDLAARRVTMKLPEGLLDINHAAAP